MRRTSGVLLPIASLPGLYGIGDLGGEARDFVRSLERSGQDIWQIIPINEPLLSQASPYHSISAFSGDPILISPALLAERGFIDRGSIEAPPVFPDGGIDYGAARRFKEPLLVEAWEHFLSRGDSGEFESFCREHEAWLDDFALFKVLKSSFPGKRWNEWPGGLRDRDAEALESARRALTDSIEREKFFQYLFFSQWNELRSFCGEKGISIVGDMAIYVEFDSADVWARREIFKLGEGMAPAFVSGVPPDYFSSTGQLWGHPVYDWDALRGQGFRWWLDRIRHNLGLYDLLRIDHFRGLLAYWEVRAGEETALNGE